MSHRLSVTEPLRSRGVEEETLSMGGHVCKGKEGTEVPIFGKKLPQGPFGRIWKDLESGVTSAVMIPRGPLWL